MYKGSFNQVYAWVQEGEGKAKVFENLCVRAVRSSPIFKWGTLVWYIFDMVHFVAEGQI